MAHGEKRLPFWVIATRWGAVLCFSFFVFNIVASKIALDNGWSYPFSLHEVSEFLLLFTSVLLFVAQTLFLERVRNNRNNQPT